MMTGLAVVCVCLLAAVVNGEGAYLNSPGVMSINDFKTYVVGKWHKETCRMQFDANVNANEIGEANRVFAASGSGEFVTNVLTGYRNSDGSIACEYHQPTLQPLNSQNAEFSISGGHRFAYLSFFTRDPSSYIGIFGCYSPPTAEGCPEHETQLKIYTSATPGMETITMIWNEMSSIGISDSDPDLITRFIDHNAFDEIFDACS